MRFLLVVCVALQAACSGDASRPGPEPDPIFQSRACERYIECSDAVADGDAAAVRIAFGNASDCWTTAARAGQCTQDCDSGLAELRADHGDLSACAECVEDIDCDADSSAPVCVGGNCRQCASDDDCAGTGEAFCSEDNFCTDDLCQLSTDCKAEEICLHTDAGRRCGRCRSDDDCPSITSPVCIEDRSGNTCHDCRTSADCFSTRPVCDEATFDCGYCTSDAQCARFPSTPHCDTESSFAGCVECIEDADCKNPAKPKCSFINMCSAS